MQDRGFNRLASNMIKSSVNETKWGSLLARTCTFIPYISIWIFDFGPEKLPRLSGNTSQGTNRERVKQQSVKDNTPAWGNFVNKVVDVSIFSQNKDRMGYFCISFTRSVASFQINNINSWCKIKGNGSFSKGCCKWWHWTNRHGLSAVLCSHWWWLS